MELIDEITLLVDNRLMDCQVVNQLETLIGSDMNLRHEYVIQKSIKNLLNKRFSQCKSPTCLCERLWGSIINNADDFTRNKKV